MAPDSWLVFITSFALALVLTPLAGRLGHRLGVVDRPGGRRGHRGTVPRLGGVALFGAFIAAIGVTAWRGGLTTGYSAEAAPGFVLDGNIQILSKPFDAHTLLRRVREVLDA